jgi:hypothetical protein
MSMTARRYRATWDEVAFLDADHCASWGAFAGYNGAMDFNGCEPARIHAEHDSERDTLSAFYVRKGEGDDAGPIRSTVRLERRPCRFGGTRVYFRCPGCGRATLRLAVLASGLLCGVCGRITWGSRRECETARLVRRANKLALRLGLDCFSDTPTRPKRMRLHTYAAIRGNLDPLRAEIERRVRKRMARAKGPFGYMPALLRWGL